MQQGDIEFRRISKTYPGAASPAVRSLDLRIEPGQICALVGPSGSGKTTIMRMVNRLIDPTSGDVLINGQPVRGIEPEVLRRSIGYVIQQVGLFPHRTIFENVALVPRMLGWDEARIRTRVHELVEMVGLSPAEFSARYPAQLSGGQRQRIGVARALAADPPVLLMDEPFGAIDPVVRGSIQDEFLRLQQHVRKTIIIVTHDIDEAIKMGDTVAVLKEGGVLAQHSTPAELLARPDSEFVEKFMGADSGIKRLGLTKVGESPLYTLEQAARRGAALHLDAAGRPAYWSDGSPAAPVIPAVATLREALASMLVSGRMYAPVVDETGCALAIVSLESIQLALRAQLPDVAQQGWRSA